MWTIIIYAILINKKKINSTVKFLKNNYLCKHLTTNVPYSLYF